MLGAVKTSVSGFLERVVTTGSRSRFSELAEVVLLDLLVSSST